MTKPKYKEFIRNCIGCNNQFIPKQSNSRYCSYQCYKNEWGRENPKCKKDWIKRNPDKRKQASAEYMKRNRPYYASYASLRTRYFEQACPKWVNKEELLKIYKEASKKGLEVDNIIPLKHPSVCGLHVPWNLQLLSRSENARKSNKFEVENVN